MSDGSNGIPTRPLGSTGEEVTIIGVGGHHIGRGTVELGVRIIRSALDEGVTFLDNAWCYHDGRSEEIMGQALRDGYRDRAFLMTKNHGRDAATFRAQLEDSLRRLGAETIDLVQFHEIIHEGEPARLYSEGALEAALRAREAGKLRYIGFTGHRWPHLLQQMLEGDFAWDTVQLPINLLDAGFRSFGKAILPELVERGIGVIGMKSLAAGQLVHTPIAPERAIAWALSQPVSTVVTGIDSLEVLEQNVRVAREFAPMSADEAQELLTMAAPHARDGHLERYKTG